MFSHLNNGFNLIRFLFLGSDQAVKNKKTCHHLYLREYWFSLVNPEK
jgi:hypothetical protein